MNNVDKPICDIIIITWNGLKYTKKCIDSIKKNTKDINYRLVFVDNNSTDGTIEFLEKISNSIIIKNNKNLGFAKAMNLGFSKISAKYTVWLNNDTIVTPNWLSKMINYLEKNEKFGAIGPVSNGTGIIQKVDGLDSDDYEDIEKMAHLLNEKFKNQVIEYHRIAGFCILMRSNLINIVGKIDETFNHGGYDDDDYCKRIRDNGYKIFIARDVFVYHKSGASFSSAKDPDFDLRYLMPLTKRKLLRKWSPKKNIEKISEKPLVSIIMTTMDREKIIVDSINSVINQTYENWELIIINDGGNNIQQVINNFDNPKIHYIHLDKNRGKSTANNIAIDNSKGEIIAYLDDDDKWHQNHLEITVNELMKDKNCLFVYSDYVRVDCIIDKSTGKQFAIKKEVIENSTARSFFVKEMNFIPNFTMVHKKELFEKVGKYDTTLDYYEDWDMIRRFSYVTPFFHIPEITGEYWIDLKNTGRNATALEDRKLEEKLQYIKSKDKKLKNNILKKLDLADSMVREKDWKESLHLYQEIYKDLPNFYPAIEGIADRLFLLQKNKEAELYLEKMIEINPYKYQTYVRIAENKIYQNKYFDAKSFLEKALVITDEKVIYSLLQKCYKKLNGKKTAEFLHEKTNAMVHNLNLHEVEDFLLKFYNKNAFNRKLLSFGFKILRKIYG